MTQEKIEKYLKNYLKNIITPRVKNMTGDENSKVEIISFIESDNIPGVYRAFLEITPYPTPIIFHQITNDVYGFFDMLGLENLPVIFWNEPNPPAKQK